MAPSTCSIAMQALRRSISSAVTRGVSSARAPRDDACLSAALASSSRFPRAYGGEAAPAAEDLVKACESLVASGKRVNWVFLGAPGVGKGTYATRFAKMMQIPHISAGDLVRDEIQRGTPLGSEMEAITSTGQLLPDAMILDILKERVEKGAEKGEKGFLLDGFPRTVHQAKELETFADVTRVLNLGLREEILIEKCCARRKCRECGKGFNVADINYPGDPPIVMPPLNPPPECADKMEQRKDDTEEIVRARLQVYKDQSIPVEHYYRERGLLTDFEITAGIPETTPKLLAVILDVVREA